MTGTATSPVRSTVSKPLRASLIAIAVVPLVTGLFGIFAGPAHLPGGAPVTPTVDSEFRFANLYWFAAGLLLLWSLRRPVERALATRAVLALGIVGGLTRLLSILLTDWPHPAYVGALAVELTVVPALLWWHHKAITP
ncbi:conserved hypothetical protein [Kribbella flavida DSM 17836]|uniref:DUF4345 domain-containing protein n=1 Tax=Kribbella flavida (strain DSM 17836 / JCM 10339 / NBRC 14399) TaxID=479435 RepID=D2PU35_KRIFD|nr:DUF4345 domain-containing protein [Kribbella flavida]ADB35086.1 conserved hypothetical protein [Kribbella flavida DSM 17836]